MMRWFILRVEGRKAPRIIETIGPTLCWRPMEIRITKPARKHKPVEIEIPMIPGWLFVHESEYQRCQELDGVYGSVKYGRLGTLWIEDDDLNGLRSACDRPTDAPQDEPERVVVILPVGAQVKLRGILYGRLGVVKAHTREGNLKIDLGNLEVTVSPRLVEAA